MPRPQWFALAGFALLFGGFAALAEPETTKKVKTAKAEKKFDPATAPEREAAALAFVRANHQELAVLLESLKPMKPSQYAHAIAELYQTSRALANLKTLDPRRYEAGLNLWKARSRVEVLAAQLASTSSPSPDLEDQLKSAIENHVEAQLTQQRLERSIVTERLKTLNSSIDRLETNRDSIIESKFQTLRKKGQRARRQDEGTPSPARPARSKGENKA